MGSLIIPCIVQFILYIILFVLIKKTDNILPNKFKKLLYSIILLYFLIVINILIIVVVYFIYNNINILFIFLFILLLIIITIIYIILFTIIFKYNNESNNKNITAIKLISICTFINGIYQILLIIYNFSK